MNLDQYRLSSAELAVIDLQIAAMPARPTPEQVATMLFALSDAAPGVTVDIAGSIMLFAICHGSTAAEAQEELFGAVKAGHLSPEFPS